MTTLSIKRLNKVLNDPRRIYDLSGTSPLLSTVIICQLKFLGHILLKEKDEPANIYALFEPLPEKTPRETA